MLARWSSFGVGLGLMLAPLVLGYGSAAAILHDVALGVVVCVATLAALEWPRARFATAIPAAWLVVAGRAAPEQRIAAAELVGGVLLLVLCVVPSARRVLPPAARRGGEEGHALDATR